MGVISEPSKSIPDWERILYTSLPLDSWFTEEIAAQMSILHEQTGGDILRHYEFLSGIGYIYRFATTNLTDQDCALW
jgi:hypothetical protein